MGLPSQQRFYVTNEASSGQPSPCRRCVLKKKSLKHAKYIAGTQNQLFGWNVRNEVAEGGLKCQMSARSNGGREMSPRKKAEVNLMVMSGMKRNRRGWSQGDQ